MAWRYRRNSRPGGRQNRCFFARSRLWIDHSRCSRIISRGESRGIPKKRVRPMRLDYSSFGTTACIVSVLRCSRLKRSRGLPTAEPSIFQLKSTTELGGASRPLPERKQERPRLSATKLKRPRAKWLRPRRRSGSLLRRRTRNRRTRGKPPASQFPTDQPCACWDCWSQGRP